MARVVTKMVNYTADFLPAVSGQPANQLLPFKIAEGVVEDCGFPFQSNLAGCGCNIAGLYSMRYLDITFDPGSAAPARQCKKVQIPVPDRTQAAIKQLVDLAKACGATCIDLVGEKWTVIPPSLAGYTSSTTPINLPTGNRNVKRKSVTLDYKADYLTGAASKVNTRYEWGADLAATSDYPALTGAIESCNAFTDKAICDFGTVKNRYAIGKGVVAPISGVGNENPTFSRQLPIEGYTAADILACIVSYGNVTGVQCVGYQGESVKRIDLLL